MTARSAAEALYMRSADEGRRATPQNPDLLRWVGIPGHFSSSRWLIGGRCVASLARMTCPRRKLTGSGAVGRPADAGWIFIRRHGAPAMIGVAAVVSPLIVAYRTPQPRSPSPSRQARIRPLEFQVRRPLETCSASDAMETAIAKTVA